MELPRNYVIKLATIGEIKLTTLSIFINYNQGKKRKLSKQIKNKVVYTTDPVAGGWAGAVISWAGAEIIWAGA